MTTDVEAPPTVASGPSSQSTTKSASAKPAVKRKRDSSSTSNAASTEKAPKKAKAVSKDATKTPKTPKKPKAPKAPKATPKAASKAASATDSAPKESTPSTVKSEEREGTPLDNDQDDVYKWWESGLKHEDDSVKWETLEHNGVLFPPPYEPLPKSVYLIYNKTPVTLPLYAEEVAGFFGAMINTDHAQNKVFQKNFFNDFLEVLKEAGGAKNRETGRSIDIKDFDKCDFSVIFKHYEAEREAKKSVPAAEKKRIKKEKDEAEEYYKFCFLNGRKQPVGNFRIEPPGLFRGRGAHPKTGKLKGRVQPEQVTINIGKDAKIPEPPAGHEWAEVRHDNSVSWLATWKENINNGPKYVFLAQNSSLKGMSDLKKFEKARELKKHVDRIRKSYRKELTDTVMQVRQRATAMYLIDVLALRAGGEKGEDEADTVGCCSLRYEHITLQPPNTVTFDFLGKDSIRYFQQVEVDRQVFNNLRIFKKAPKGPGDDIFDRLDPGTLNKHLQSYMPGLSAKVFRTFNASFTMQQQLDQIPVDGNNVQEKLFAFNAANREVAILCNHQRTVSKGHEQSMVKIESKIQVLEWQKYRLKKMLLQIDPNRPKVLGKQYFSDLKSLTKTQIKKIHANVIEEEREKVNKKYLRDNEKLKIKREEGENVELLTEKDLKERLQEVDELAKKYAKELETDEYEIKGKPDLEKLEGQVAKVEERIIATRLSMQDKQENSTVALGTSKVNYIDPRLIVMFSKKHSVPIEKLFTKTLREKFEWAIHSADENWTF